MHRALRFLLIGSVFSIGNCKSDSDRLITVVASVAEPFVIYDENSSTPKGLDVDIINNFAKQFNLQVKFLMANENLNEISANGNQRLRSFVESVFES